MSKGSARKNPSRCFREKDDDHDDHGDVDNVDEHDDENDDEHDGRNNDENDDEHDDVDNADETDEDDEKYENDDGNDAESVGFLRGSASQYLELRSICKVLLEHMIFLMILIIVIN